MNKYCGQCGAEIPENATSCEKCGLDPRKGYKFCPQCGAERNPEAVICVKCKAKLTPESKLKENISGYLSATGRISRQQWILQYLLGVWGLVALIITVCFLVLPFLFFIPFLAVPVLAYAGIVGQIKRYHDLDMSGYCWLLSFVPIVNLAMLFILLFKKGTAGPNTYGADPLV